MKAITIWQPWATWIALGWKTIETRTHNRLRGLVGQRIAIHAAKRAVCRDAYEDALILMNSTMYRQAWDIGYPRGVVLCTVRVAWAGRLFLGDSSAAMCHCPSDLDEGLYGLRLEDIELLDPPVEARGYQGPWNWSQA